MSEGKRYFGEYIHGGDIYRSPVDYDFSVNINPLGMPQGSLEAAQRALLLCGRYPDWQGEALRSRLAVAEGVRPEQIILGNGAAELIYALCYFVLSEQKGRNGLIPAPAFGEYEAALLAAGGNPVFWNLKEEHAFCPEEDFLDAITEETAILFLCNPNNPTGSIAARRLLLLTAQKCEQTQTFFCLDECFLPFLEREEELSLKGVLERFPHLVILRAFTKLYGMPGLRLGYAMSANRTLLEGMRRCLQPWNTSIPAQAAGLAALEDSSYLVWTKRTVEEGRRYLLREMSLGLAEKIYPSSANYIFFRSRPDLKALLQKEGVLIRSCSNYRNLEEGYFRIGIRTQEENQELIRRWKHAVAEENE